MTNFYGVEVYGSPRRNRSYTCFRCGTKRKGRELRFWHETRQPIAQNGCIPICPTCPGIENRCEEISSE